MRSPQSSHVPAVSCYVSDTSHRTFREKMEFERFSSAEQSKSKMMSEFVQESRLTLMQRKVIPDWMEVEI